MTTSWSMIESGTGLGWNEDISCTRYLLRGPCQSQVGRRHGLSMGTDIDIKDAV